MNSQLPTPNRVFPSAAWGVGNWELGIDAFTYFLTFPTNFSNRATTASQR